MLVARAGPGFDEDVENKKRGSSMRLLLVEDDTGLRAQLAKHLTQAGYAVDHAVDLRDAIHMAVHEAYDLVVLDRGLPDGDGIGVVAALRRADNLVPVLMLTVRDAWQEKVEALSAGADDYVTKPFHVQELLARVQALIRRRHGQGSTAIQRGAIRLDVERQSVMVGDEVIALSGIEFRLLHYFMMHAGHVLSRTRLYEHIYDHAADNDSNVIEVYVSHLRSKLGKGTITTRRGQGYVFLEHAQP
jgi:two-component system, OmpR family, response regulator